MGETALRIGRDKTDHTFVEAVALGILCNVLVCLGVWLAYAGRSVTDKIVGLILPISAFVAAGFEHCVANMYFLPLAWLLTETGRVPAGFDASNLNWRGCAVRSRAAGPGWRPHTSIVAARADRSTREKRMVTMRMGRESLVGAKTRL